MFKWNKTRIEPRHSNVMKIEMMVLERNEEVNGIIIRLYLDLKREDHNLFIDSEPQRAPQHINQNSHEAS